MPNRTDVLIETRSLSITPGEIAQITATVQNSGDTVSQFAFRLTGLDSDWYNLPVSSTTLFPNDQEDLKITFHPPRTGNVKPGLYTCHLIIDCPENPENSEDVEILLEIKDIPELKLEITPELVTGNKGTYRIIVHNPGHDIAVVNLIIDDHAPLLHCNLLPISLSVPGGESSESRLEVKLGWSRFFRGQRQFDFTVIAKQADSDRIKTVNGCLRKTPKKVRLPFRFSLPSKIRRYRQPPCINEFKATTDDNRKYSLVWAVENAREVRLDDEKTGLLGDLQVRPVETISYTLVASNRQGSVSQTITVEPLPAPMVRYSDRILVFMTPNILQVSAGGESVEAIIEIQNTGTIVDRFSLEIEGLAQSWYSLSDSSVSLMPHGKEQIQVSFHPPKVPGVKSDYCPFAVTLRSQSIPEDSASTTAQLEVLPSVDFGITIKPYRILCRRKCSFVVQISNKDVSDANVYLDVSDIESGLRFRLENDNPTVPPWQNIEIPMMVRPKRNSIVGDIKRYDISVTAGTAEGYTQFARCQLDHRPLLSSWRPVLRAFKYAVILGVAGFAIYYIIGLGGGWSSLVRDPQAWLDGTIRHIRGWFY